MPDGPQRHLWMALGKHLVGVRKAKGLSLVEVEAKSAGEFKGSILSAYERGERAISVVRLERLAVFYGVPVSSLLPRGSSARSGLIDLSDGHEPNCIETGGGSHERTLFDLECLAESNCPRSASLLRYLSEIRDRRQQAGGRLLAIRLRDLQTAAVLFASCDADVRGSPGKIVGRPIVGSPVNGRQGRWAANHQGIGIT